jgi:hypothetical protein
MADPDAARQRFDDAGLGEVVAHEAEAVRRMESCFGMVGDNAARFLSAMLQGVHSERNDACGIDGADDTEDATLLFQLVVVEGVAGQVTHGGEFLGGSRCRDV